MRRTRVHCLTVHFIVLPCLICARVGPPPPSSSRPPPRSCFLISEELEPELKSLGGLDSDLGLQVWLFRTSASIGFNSFGVFRESAYGVQTDPKPSQDLGLLLRLNEVRSKCAGKFVSTPLVYSSNDRSKL